ncbi:hypothetical protein Tsubulata_044828 [Turnera subulata]|uniref:Uncharacterized protein n=1 Tax=Turnera subulata TaxID=218843 RepID=A0A9Q0IXP0_9ROSI|nr:hypothetical protein Tsubulata_044828 [Turnera subulata]
MAAPAEVAGDVHRPLANFPPTIWGCDFASFSFPQSEFESYSRQVELLKEEIHGMLMSASTNLIDENIEFINLLCRLGVSYHFEAEIDEQLTHIFHTNEYQDYDDLYTVALFFRILRQHGYKDNNGSFKKCIANDAKGLLSLYEATYLSMHGEEIMEEALAFTRERLEVLAASQSSPCMAKHIRMALNRPFHHGVPRLEARQYISLYEEEDSSNEVLLEFAKLDFNRVQILHQQELALLSRWWEGLNLVEKLPYARDRIVEIYFWANGVHFEPQYSVSRMMVAKHTTMVSMLDDTYDAYGTFEELQYLTEAIERCDVSAIDKLPADYLRVVYKTLLNAFRETEEEMSKHGRSFSADYTKKAFIELVKAYHVEAQWAKDRHIPSFKEYFQNGTISSSYGAIIAASFIASEVAGIKEYQWLSSTPKIVRAGMAIGRLMNDIVGHETVHQVWNATLKNMASRRRRQLRRFRRCVNEECMKPTTIPWLLLRHCVNLIRVGGIVYWRDDAYTDPSTQDDVAGDLQRPLANFPPTIWGCDFASFSFPESEFESCSRQVEVLTEETHGMLTSATRNPVENLEFINSLCRLGVSYHFEAEIDEQLSHIFQTNEYDDYDDLYTVALLFRILRQHGYKVPCHVFQKFKENNGSFKKCIANDAKGLLSLYEATYLSVQGEDIMEEALAFTRERLEVLAASSQSSPCLAKQIKMALNRPFHHGVPRLEARQYISLYEEDESSNEILLKFAKFSNSTPTRALPPLEMVEGPKSCEEKLPYARDRIVEIYFWANGTHFEPQYSVSRMMVAKRTMMVSVLDDTYDAYGTFEELQCLTEAIERCDMTAINKLPADIKKKNKLPADYLRIVYEALFNVLRETEEEMSKHGRSFSADYTKEANGTVSSSYGALLAASFTGTEVAGVNEYLWLRNTPKILRAAMAIGRLKNDIVGHEEEQKRGDCASGVECYIKEHGVSKEEAVEKILKICENSWKDINEEFMKPTTIPLLLLKHVVNLTRVTDAVYWLDDAYTNPLSLKDHINMLFIQQIPV